MFIELRQDDPRPIFRQISDEIALAVLVGVLKMGDALPGTRQLAQDLKLNPNTVRHAYQTLQHEGILEMRRGRGAFILAAPHGPRYRSTAVARQIAERALREGFRHGLLASDLMKALQEIAPR